jgi:hypothetical protein
LVIYCAGQKSRSNKVPVASQGNTKGNRMI